MPTSSSGRRPGHYKGERGRRATKLPRGFNARRQQPAGGYSAGLNEEPLTAVSPISRAYPQRMAAMRPAFRGISRLCLALGFHAGFLFRFRNASGDFWRGFEILHVTFVLPMAANSQVLHRAIFDRMISRWKRVARLRISLVGRSGGRKLRDNAIHHAGPALPVGCVGALLTRTEDGGAASRRAGTTVATISKAR